MIYYTSYLTNDVIILFTRSVDINLKIFAFTTTIIDQIIEHCPTTKKFT